MEGWINIIGRCDACSGIVIETAGTHKDYKYICLRCNANQEVYDTEAAPSWILKRKWNVETIDLHTVD